MYINVNKLMVRTERLVHLYSTAANSNGTSHYSQFTCSFTNAEWSMFDVPRMIPVMIQMPSTFDNVTDTNNFLEFSVNGVDKSVRLANRYYPLTELLTEITSKINAAIGSTSVTITQEKTGHLKFVNSAAATQKVILSNTQPNNLCFALGIVDTFELTATGSEPPMTPNVFTPLEVLVHCERHVEHYSLHEAKRDTSVVAHLPFQFIPYGSMALFQASDFHAHSIPIHNQDVTTFNIRLTDGFYNPIYLPKNQSVHIQMKIFNDK